MQLADDLPTKIITVINRFQEVQIINKRLPQENKVGQQKTCIQS